MTTPTRSVGLFLVVALGCSSATSATPAPSVDAGGAVVECRGSPGLTVSNASYSVPSATDFGCGAEAGSAIVRLHLCAAPPDPSPAKDDEVSYCVVVDLARDALTSLVGAAPLRLDGTTHFTFPSPSVYAVRPADVTYVAASPTPAVTRVWMEKQCFCTPVSLGADQTLTGSLRFDPAPAGRLRGHLTLTAQGAVSPTTWLPERATLDMNFDAAIDETDAGL